MIQIKAENRWLNESKQKKDDEEDERGSGDDSSEDDLGGVHLVEAKVRTGNSLSIRKIHLYIVFD